jgi:pSer/pThr/pTyr-binding forkhead associated (FHA) protein
MPIFGLQDSAGNLTAVDREVSIGRDAACRLRLANDRLVAGVHATLWADEHCLRVRDERSINGTFVNDERLKPGLARELADGDHLRVGSSVWTVQRLFDAPANPLLAAPYQATPGERQPRAIPDWVVVAGAIAAVLAAVAAAIVALGNR